MPSCYGPQRGALQAEISARIAAGERLKAVTALPGMPRATTVRAWAATDPAFADALAQAYAQAAQRRRTAWDPARAEAFLVRLREGVAVHRLLARPSQPGGLPRRVYRQWMLTRADFAEEVRRVIAVYAPEHARRRREVRTPWDPDLADRVLVHVITGGSPWITDTAATGLPGRWTLLRWRKEQPDFDAEMTAARRIATRRRGRARSAACALALTDDIVERILTGDCLATLAREPGFPALRTLLKWVATNEDFALTVNRASFDRDDWYREQLLMLPEDAPKSAERAIRRRWGQLQNRPGRKWR